MKKLWGFLTVLVVLVLATYLFLRWEWSPYGLGGTVFIPRGSSVQKIGDILSEHGILRNTWSFKLLVRLEGAETQLKAGEYAFDGGIGAREVLDKLRRGEIVVHYLTIPEGYNFAQIAKAIAETGIATESEVQTAFRDPQYLSLLGFPVSSLEGYLFPATYPYDRGTQLPELLQAMIRSFLANFDESMRARMAEGN